MNQLRDRFFIATVLCILTFAAACPAVVSAADNTRITITLPGGGVCHLGDTLTFSGTNNVSDTTYLFLTGPRLNPSGSQIRNADPKNAPVIDGDASTFAAAGVGPEKQWSWAFDTSTTTLEPGTYTLYATSAPHDKAHITSASYNTKSFVILHPTDPYAAGSAEPTADPAAESAESAGDGTSVTITSPQNGRFTYGDTLTFSGTNTVSGTTYLFMTGPNLKTGGSQIQSIHPAYSPVIDDDASTFAAAAVLPDRTWSWTWNTNGVFIDSGTYTVYAASTPRDRAHVNSTHFDRVALIIKPPGSLSARIETAVAQPGNAAAESLTQPSVAVNGDIVTVSGIARNKPSCGVGIWIIGTPVNGNFTAVYANQFVAKTDAAGSYSLDVDTKGSIREGSFYVVVQHPMVNNILDISITNDTAGGTEDRWVINNIVAMSGGTGSARLFKIGGPGSLIGADTYEALVSAFSDPMVDDRFVTYPVQTATPVRASAAAASTVTYTTEPTQQNLVPAMQGQVTGGKNQEPAGSGSMLNQVIAFFSGLL